MNLKNLYIARIRISTIFWLLIVFLFAYSCDDDNLIEKTTGDKINLNLNISAPTTRSGDSDSEGDVYNLRMIALDNQGDVLYNWLVYNDNTSGVDKTLKITIPKGKYKIYFIANAEGRASDLYPSVSSLSNIDDEDELKEVLLSYSGNAPESPFIMTTVWTIQDYNTNVTRDIELEHTCVKVSYTLYFNNTLNMDQKPLKDKRFEVKSIQFKQLAQKSYLIESESVVPSQTYFNGNVRTISGSDFDFDKDEWTYTGTAYIPECLYTLGDDVTYSHMKIVGNIIGSSISSTYTIDLTGDVNNTNQKITPRGREYQIAATIKGLGERDGLDVGLNIVNWTDRSLSTSIGGQYTLWVSKTKLSIESLKNDTLHYTSNAPAISFSFDDEYCAYELPESNTPQKGMVIIKAGSASIVGNNMTGSSVLSVKLSDNADPVSANDVLTKKIPVDYNFTPYLKVIPQLVEINWESETQEAKDLNKTTRNVKYETNLPIVTILNNTAPSGHSVNDLGEGKIQIEAPELGLNDQTVKYTFDVEAKSLDGSITIIRTVTVIVKPDLSGIFRVHFRVINDALGGTSNTMKRWANCYLDMYNETGTNISRFLGDWPGTQMYYDEAKNNGWFYFDIDKNKTPNAGGYDANNTWKGLNSSARMESGITLMMFTYKNSEGYQVQQRYPAHKDPGIPLFNFDDSEGWFVYDPTARNGTLEFYDEEPDIIDVTYTFGLKISDYWPAYQLHLYTRYGSKNNNRPGTGDADPHTLTLTGDWFSTSDQGLYSQGGNYYKRSFTNMKALKDNQAKHIYFLFHYMDDTSKRYPYSGYADQAIFGGKDIAEGWFDYSSKTWTETQP